MFLGEMADSRVETGKYKAGLVHLVLRKLEENNRSWPKDMVTSLKEGFHTSQIRDDSIKISSESHKL